MAFFPPRRHKLMRALFRRVFRTPYYMIRTAHDLLLVIDEGSAVDRRLARRKRADAEQIARFFTLARRAAERLGKPFDVLDASTRKGLFAMLAAHEERAGDILAFEADIQNRNQLGAQLFLNALSRRIEVLPLAIGGSPGHAHRRFAEDSAAMGTILTLDPPRGRRQSVEIQPLDAVISWRGRLVVGAIDAREEATGFLDGARRTLAENLCLWQIETGADAERLTALAESLGLRALDVLGRDRYFTNIPPEILKA
ncbi:hypothetical protein [Ponticoccus alexandrii]|uniref:Uncharacterized protein n=1 Tax=Ponticoccus alexandrii TaxID=1943633 RepID=A0ABX7F6A8_9RHOB|nr:hypothetical protein [Ponticoccus alexandrii]ETA52465.1 hypothetical protein P279_08460 [Rhodobacteraceae bacterium PD-2]QRF65356.1 hypothetical protein GQA70_02910 [Ponticoccus alexandrii]